ncbi:MAG: hypothetical protein MI919_07310, partial [Holophagales bacterium]|nr:hypothetical protein [Holophagales bacterium]
MGFEAGSDGSPRPRPACHPLLQGLASAGVGQVVLVLRAGKWDVPAALGSGASLGLDLAYVLADDSRSVPESLARARAWVDGADVALGFPDILLEPADVWPRLAAFHLGGTWDVSLGCFPTEQAWKADMVDFE